MLNDPDNSDRAQWAENAVNVFAQETYCGRTFTATVKEQPERGDDAYTMCQDLISDILHLAHRHGWSASDMIENAKACFDEELEEEAEAESDECGQCEGSGITDAMGTEEECPVCNGAGIRS